MAAQPNDNYLENPIIKLMTEHASTRNYNDQPVEPEKLDALIEGAMRGPTSINSQQVSLVITKDAERRKTIAELAGGQRWIAEAPVFITLVADLHKTEVALEGIGKQQVIQDSVEGFGVTAVDVGITLGNLMTAARALGLSIVPIGGIRNNPQKMIEMLKLPQHTFPLVGLCVGYSDNPGIPKPRLPKATFVHRETYSSEGLKQHIADYNHELVEHWQKTGRSDGDDWSTSIASYYTRIYYPDELQALKDQGFGFEK